MNQAQAIDALRTIPRDEFAEMCIDLSKDIHGVKFRWLWDYDMDGLVEFFLDCYEWDNEKQVWNFQQHIQEQMREEDEWYADLRREEEEEQTNPWVLMCRGEEND